MAHIFFIDPIEKLNPKKDSTLYLAQTLQSLGAEVYLLFEKDFAYINRSSFFTTLYDFKVDRELGAFYLKSITLEKSISRPWQRGDIFHFRLDPPFDARYLRYLWMADALSDLGVKVINNPKGIATYNEKLTAYRFANSHPSFVGSSVQQLQSFIDWLRSQGHQAIILKPLDLYQGYGVTKVDISDSASHSWREIFGQMVEIHKGPIVAQPFLEQVKQGEIRGLFWRARELASILKIPPAGSFLANIAQGASFHLLDLDLNLTKDCTQICKELMKVGVDWVAFDILGGRISEVNVTCPGLLVECASAKGEDLAKIIAQSLE